MALLGRVALLFSLTWIIGLTEPVFTLVGHGVSGKDIILAVGGLFLIYKATTRSTTSSKGRGGAHRRTITFAVAVTQIALIDLVFSIDSIVTAVGMANELR